MPRAPVVHRQIVMRRLLASLCPVLSLCLLPACGPAEESSGSTPEETTTTTTTTTETTPYEAPQLSAGFFEVQSEAAAAFPARLFYSFHPADKPSAQTPILVFFNGGPGSATTAGLLPYGTAPFTLDPSMKEGDPPIPNPDSMTRFAHLLHVDARQTGFSYGLPGGCNGTSNPEEDAADFLFGLLDFMDARPGLLHAPVVLVGESYGGTRAPTMIHMLQHYGEADPAHFLPDAHDIPGLVDRIQAHFDLAEPERAGQIRTPDEVTDQFGAMILIQPNIGGMVQFQYEEPLVAADPLMAPAKQLDSGINPYDVRTTIDDLMHEDLLATTAMLTPSSFEKMIGLPPEEVPLFGPADRKDAFRFEPSPPLPDTAFEAMESRVGKLAPGDFYWTGYVPSCGPWLGDVATLSAFLGDARRTSVFVTRAHYDSVVYSPAFPGLLSLAQGLTVTLDDAPRPGVDRPGWVHIDYETGEKTEIRFPPYEAGHAVAISEAHALSVDVESWLRETGILQ